MSTASPSVTFQMMTLHYILQLSDDDLAKKAMTDIMKAPAVSAETRQRVTEHFDGFEIERPVDGDSVKVQLRSKGEDLFLVNYQLS